ncbi:MAG: helix-hairpin-helix domain-containing protein [Desulfuromonadales bacterium]|nr:helix-hairpin-helix domain-containing protein [Desulfuromonadales bacterium]
MDNRYLKFFIFLVLLAVSYPLLQGSAKDKHKSPPSFLHYSSDSVLIDLKGDCEAPGLYNFADGTTFKSANIESICGFKKSYVENPDQIMADKLNNGEEIEIQKRNNRDFKISIKRMRAKELILLKIPLDPDKMDYEDWISMPGIGPALAGRIIEDRNSNGNFVKIENLQRVSGIGEKKVEKIKRYFYIK